MARRIILNHPLMMLRNFRPDSSPRISSNRNSLPSQFDLSAQSQVETSDQGSPPGQMSISGLDGAAATAVASAQPGLIQVTDPVANTPGYEQSVPNYNSAYAMTS